MDDLTAMLDEAKKRKESNVIDLTSGNFIQPKQETNRIPQTNIDLTAKPKAQAVSAAGKISPNAVAFDPTTIIPKKPKVDENAANPFFSALDIAVDRTKEEISENHKQLEAAMYEEFMNQEEGEEQTEPAPSIEDSNSSTNEEDEVYTDTLSDSNKYTEPQTVNEVEVHTPQVDQKVTKETSGINKASFSRPITASDTYEVKDDEDDTPAASVNEEQEAQELLDGLKEAAQVIKPKMELIDFSKFSIADHGVKASTVIVSTESRADVADWVLYDLGQPVSMKGLTGPELIKMDPNNSTRNRRNTIKDIYQIIYDHVVSKNKPSFEDWLRQIPYSDLDHLYFALYKATFGKSNYVSYQCPDCKKIFLTEVSFEDMVNFKDDKVKETYNEIMSKNTDSGKVPYPIERVQVSDKFVFDMKIPSLYNILMEISGLPENITEKYSTLVDIISYIDAIYTIDYANMKLIPVMIPAVKDDPVKSAVKRIKAIADILKNLTSDEYQIVSTYAAKSINKSSDITYKIPAVKCPECDKDIPANEGVSAQDLLFTRHQLGAFANM